MTRAVSEWIGKTDDAAIPPRVRARVFEAYGGRCHWSGKKIMPGDQWDCDHIIALINGGQHRETNLAPILRGKEHAEKTADDLAVKKKIARVRAKHLGIAPKTRAPLRSRGFSSSRIWQPLSKDFDHDDA